MNPRFTLYTKDVCPLCDEAVDVLRAIQKRHFFEYDVVDITNDPEYLKRYRDLVPVLVLDDEPLFYGNISAHRLEQIVLKVRRRPPGDNRSVLTPRYKAFLNRLRALKTRQDKSRDKRH